MNTLQTEILTHWQDESGRGLRPEFSGRFLTADGTLTEDAMALRLPRDAFAAHRWHVEAGCFLAVLDEAGIPTDYVQTTNPPTVDVSMGYVPMIQLVENREDDDNPFLEEHEIPIVKAVPAGEPALVMQATQDLPAP